MDFLDKKIEEYSALHTSIESNLLNDLNRETCANVMNPRMLWTLTRKNFSANK